MPNVTIRNVPKGVRDALAARAARQGRSMQEYLLGELSRLAERPSMEEWVDRVRTRVKATGTRLTAKEILEARDEGRRGL